MSDKYPGGFVTANAPAGFSVAFDGTGDYLSTPSAASLQLTAATAFTIEAWAYPTSFPNTDHGIIGKRAGGAVEWQFFFKNDKTLHFYTGLGDYGSGTAISGVNQWVHCAVTWDLTTLRFFINGALCSSTHSSILFNTPSTADVTIGADYAGAELWYGYLSNVRVLKGTALYTTAFTPPTQLFPITNTSLLTCQSPTIIDNSTNNFTITAVGDAKVSNFTPFAAYTGFNPALGAAAGGVWTLDEAAYYQNNRQWPIYDPYFNQTTLMLHGNGTNAAQNNTFLDSSTNNFTITRNGNTTQGSFTPFSQTGWSNYLASSSALGVTLPSGGLGSGDFTIECWVYLNSLYDYINFFSTTRGSTGFNMGTDAAGLLVWYSSGARQIALGKITANQWQHVAFVRSGSTLTGYLNGVSVGTATVTTNFSTTSGSIGSLDGGSEFMSGYISNLRIVTGTAVYTSNFTPSTAPLTAVTNTRLLTCQNNRFVDNSANNIAVNPTNGSPSVQAFSPFVPAYITPTTYSNWFSSGNLTTPSSAAFNLSSGDWTIEGWFLLNTNSDDTRLFTVVNSSTDMYGAFVRSGTVRFGQIGVSEAAFGTLSLNTLTHIAFVKTSTSTITCYINGISTGTTTSYTLPNANCTVYIAASPANYALSTTNGVISNFRIVKGTAVYTAQFTPPTAPLTAISGTQLLTCQSSTFIDNSTNAFTITATGNVQPVTSPTPFPAKVDTTTLNSAYSTSLIGGSGYFDGSGDYLNTTSSANLAFGTGDFTVDFWIYATSLPASDNNILNQNLASGTPQFYIDSSGKLQYRNAFVGAILTSNTTFKSGQWYYCAIARASGTSRMFINGALDTSGADTTNWSNTAGWYVSNNSGPFTGYIAGSRLIKGTALYTQAFAPPTTPPTAVTNTQLLLNYTNGAIFDNTAKNVLETAGGAALSSTQAKYGTTSMYFDGSGDWLVAANGRNFINGTEPFTIECWVYITGTPNYWSICGAGGGTLVLTIQNLTTININPYGSANTLSATTSLSINTWTHIAATRNSANRFDIWVNGVSAGNATSSQSFGSPTYYAIGAADSGTTQPFIGYLDDVRITKACRYFGTFTPPTSQLQDQ